MTFPDPGASTGPEGPQMPNGTPGHRRTGGGGGGSRPKPIAVLILVLAVVVLAAGALRATVFKGSEPIPSATPPSLALPGDSPTPPDETESPVPEPTYEPAWVGPGPINPDFPALTTLRGNWTRNFFGIGPVPLHPKIAWREGPWCGMSADGGPPTQWCGTGWNGQPNVIPMEDGSVEVRIGGYDYEYHYLDGATGNPTRKSFRTGDLAKGSASSDPDGCALHYAGSRDNRFRVLAVDKAKARELWSITAKSGEWNDDWDGAAQVVDDYLLVGGEDSWFRIIKLNRDCQGKAVRANPKVVWEVRGYDGALQADLAGNQDPADVSIENSPAYDPARKVVYFGNGGGLVQGYDITKILNGGNQADRVFSFWMGGENDASIVIADDGDLIASAHYQPPNSHAQKTGQLVRLDPKKKGNPVVWKIKASGQVSGEAGFFSTPALVGDVLYATSTDGEFMAIDAQTGKKYWTEQLTPPLWSGPAVVDGVAVLGDCSGHLMAFDVSEPTKKPKELWDMNLGGCIESTPAIWNGWIYVGTRSGNFLGIVDKHLVKLRKQWEADHGPFPVPPGFSPPK